MIKNKLIEYKNNQISFAELNNYTQSKYADGIKVLDDILAAYRISENKIDYSLNQNKQILEYRKILDTSYWLKATESKKDLLTSHNIFRVNLPQKETKWLEGSAQPEKLANGEVLWYAFANMKKKGICDSEKIKYINIFTEVITRAIGKNLDERKIEKLTYYDSLTDLYNRRFFEEEMKRLDTSRNLPISIIIADLNGLKIINDSYGHKKGEEILKNADDKMYKNKLSKSRSSKSNIVEGLINVLNSKSNETKKHSVRMTKLALEFGEKLNLSNEKQNRLSVLATLHDIGKVNIDEKILKKKDKLSKKEWETIKKHSEYGYKIAKSSEEFAEEILAHHERWDGEGYPNNLKGEDIPYLARIISIIDAYDVMTNDRSYKKAISKEKALKEIKDCAASQFDCDLAEVFVEMMINK